MLANSVIKLLFFDLLLTWKKGKSAENLRVCVHSILYSFKKREKFLQVLVVAVESGLLLMCPVLSVWRQRLLLVNSVCCFYTSRSRPHAFCLSPRSKRLVLSFLLLFPQLRPCVCLWCIVVGVSTCDPARLKKAVLCVCFVVFIILCWS